MNVIVFYSCHVTLTFSYHEILIFSSCLQTFKNTYYDISASDKGWTGMVPKLFKYIFDVSRLYFIEFFSLMSVDYPHQMSCWPSFRCEEILTASQNSKNLRSQKGTKGHTIALIDTEGHQQDTEGHQMTQNGTKGHRRALKDTEMR